MTPDDDNDTPHRHEIRWYVATFQPVPEIQVRVRGALSHMSEKGRAFELARIQDVAPHWHAALSAEEIHA
jgi:hypothetical protein